MKDSPMTVSQFASLAIAAFAMFAQSATAQIPNPGMTINPDNTALVVIDPQNDFLSPDGVTWGVVGESVTENNTVANIELTILSNGESALLKIPG